GDDVAGACRRPTNRVLTRVDRNAGPVLRRNSAVEGAAAVGPNPVPLDEVVRAGVVELDADASRAGDHVAVGSPARAADDVVVCAGVDEDPPGSREAPERARTGGVETDR